MVETEKRNTFQATQVSLKWPRMHWTHDCLSKIPCRGSVAGDQGPTIFRTQNQKLENLPRADFMHQKRIFALKARKILLLYVFSRTLGPSFKSPKRVF